MANFLNPFKQTPALLQKNIPVSISSYSFTKALLTLEDKGITLLQLMHHI